MGIPHGTMESPGPEHAYTYTVISLGCESHDRIILKHAACIIAYILLLLLY